MSITDEQHARNVVNKLEDALASAQNLRDRLASDGSASLDDPAYCTSYSPQRYICTKLRDHEGDHECEYATWGETAAEVLLKATIAPGLLSDDDALVDTVMNEVVEANALPDNTVIPGHSHPGPERDELREAAEAGGCPLTNERKPHPAHEWRYGSAARSVPMSCPGWSPDDVGSTAQRSKLSWAQAVEAITGIDFDPPPGGGWYLTKDDARDILEAVQYDRRADEEVSSAPLDFLKLGPEVAKAFSDNRGGVIRGAEVTAIRFTLDYLASRDSQGVES